MTGCLRSIHDTRGWDRHAAATGVAGSRCRGLEDSGGETPSGGAIRQRLDPTVWDGKSAMSPSAEHLVLEASKSDELRDQFLALRTCSKSPDQRKFSDRTCDKLAKLIVTRTYAPTVLQLCHLIEAVIRVDPGDDYIEFFMQANPAQPDTFRAVLAQRLDANAQDGGVEIRGRCVVVRYPDGEFLVHFSMMPVLSALFELCINAFEATALDEIFDEMRAGGATASGVSRAANRTSGQLYDYLREHLLTVQEQRKLRHMVDYMERSCGAAFGSEAIDDERVLSFWCDESAATHSYGTDFKLFGTVVRGFVLFRKLLGLGAARVALDRAGTLGSDWERGEIDVGSFDPEAFELAFSDSDDPEDADAPPHLRSWVIGRVVDQIDDDEGPLVRLSEEPLARIKFLNNTERRELASVIESGEQSTAMPLSILRAEVFDPLQRKVSRAPQGRRQDLIAGLPERSYSDFRRRLGDLLEHVRRISAASAFVIASARERAQKEKSERPIDLEDYRRGQAELKRINRAGFDAASLADPEILQGFESAAEPLIAILDCIARYRDRLDHESNLDEIWEQDCKLFAARFARLYGERSS